MTVTVRLAADWQLRLAQETFQRRSAATRHGEQTAKRVCPIDTGGLVESITSDTEHDHMSSRISAGGDGIDYAAVVELGGRPHEIRSKGPWPLRDKDGNVFGRVVQHPGTPAQPYLRPGASSIGGFK